MVEQQKQEPDIPELSRTQVLIAMGITAIILWTVAKLWLGFGDVILFRLYWQPTHLVWGLGLGLSITIFSSVAYRISSDYRESADYYLRMVLKPLALPDLIWLGLLPGLSEELLFRGVMLPALGADNVAVIISSLCFGVLHLTGAKQWPYVVWATIIGIVLSYGALWSGNLLLPIVAHTSTNWLASYLWKRWQMAT